jgi:hypothetical protein
MRTNCFSTSVLRGGFEGWVARRLRMSRAAAYRLLDVHKQLSGLESVSGWDTLPREVLYLLARESTPAEVREEAIERAEAGERLRP